MGRRPPGRRLNVCTHRYAVDTPSPRCGGHHRLALLHRADQRRALASIVGLSHRDSERSTAGLLTRRRGAQYRTNARPLPSPARRKPARRRVGRPPAHEGRLAHWINKANRTREDVARELGMSRRYLDHLCREERRPGVEYVALIEKMTGGEVDAAYWASIRSRSKKRQP
ncbi:MAG: XRE family transcriptional regulator [Sorangiineae bacterium PRO1]|nr:XRE family transcriptional regulator [Sorangiineae bacterium PRO1]